MFNPVQILLVDDNPFYLEAMQEFLNLEETLNVAGIAVEGTEAIEQAMRLQPDVILLDLNLGKQSSLELIPFLKKNIPQAKVVAITMMDEKSYRSTAMNAGADAFVHKADIVKTMFSVIFGLMDSSTKDQTCPEI